MTIDQDYLAGTDPTNANSVLRITSGTFGGGGTNVNLTWDSVPTRLYYIQKSVNLVSNIWADSGLGTILPSTGLSTTSAFTETNAPMRFYRVEAALPLSP